MANQIKVAMVSTILTLRQQGWSLRKIARTLGIHRETVARYVHLAEDGSKPATNPTLGKNEPAGPDSAAPASGTEPAGTSELTTDPTLGNEEAIGSDLANPIPGTEPTGASKPATDPTLGKNDPAGPDSAEPASGTEPTGASKPATNPTLGNEEAIGSDLANPIPGTEPTGASKPATNPTLGNEEAIGSDLANPVPGTEPTGTSKPATNPTLGKNEPAGPDLAAPAPKNEEPAGAEPANPIPGADTPVGAKPANPILENPGPPSQCDPFREVVEQKLDAGLCAKRIWQDLVADHGFAASYSSVKRFVRRLGNTSPLPFRRMECDPAQEAQVDFGRGAPVDAGQGKRRRPHVFRIVLSHSRKGYSESVWRQTTDEFVRVMENAFWALGGVPKTLVIDNLRAAVKKADWFDPELSPKVEAFCRHYGTVILPARPYTPRHKGKVESGIKYVQNNALKGRVFPSLAAQNQHLQHWESQVADHRIHGTTQKQVKRVFQEAEREALLPLPSDRFPFFHEAERSVHRDAHVEVDKAYYSVPPEYLGRQVWVRWDTRLVRIFNHRFEQVAVHAKRERGQFSTAQEHIASEKISGVERGADFLLKRARLIGPDTERWARTMLQERGIQGVRVLVGLLSLTNNHPAQHINQACEAALTQGSFRLQALRTLMQTPVRQEEFEFVQDHPLIRPLDDYGRRIPVCFRQSDPQSPSKNDDGFCEAEDHNHNDSRQDPENEFIAFQAANGLEKGQGPAPSRAQPVV